MKTLDKVMCRYPGGRFFVTAGMVAPERMREILLDLKDEVAQSNLASSNTNRPPTRESDLRIKQLLRGALIDRIFVEPSVQFTNSGIWGGKKSPMTSKMSTGQKVALQFMWIIRQAEFEIERGLIDLTPAQASRSRAKANRLIFIDGIFSSLSDRHLIKEAMNGLKDLGGNFQIIGLLHSTTLVKQIGVDSIAVAEALRELHRSERIRYVPDARGQPVSGYVDVVMPEVEVPAHHTAWQAALANAGFSQAVADNLIGLSVKLHDMNAFDMAVLAVALKNVSDLVLADCCRTDEAGFNFSARRIMSGSKVLSMLSEKMLVSLGLPLRLHLSFPRYLIYAGPAGASTTLLIENLQVFENAVRAGLAQSMALVCTYEFGIAYIGQDWLHAAQSSAHDTPIMLTRQGAAPTFRELFAVKNVMFWGDLDVAGLAIYNRRGRVLR